MSGGKRQRDGRVPGARWRGNKDAGCNDSGEGAAIRVNWMKSQGHDTARRESVVVG